MRLSFLIPIVMVLGTGCIVRDPDYTTGYVAVGYGAEYPVYYSDGYYWSYYDDGWYLWSQDRWVVSSARPTRPVRLTNTNGNRGYPAPGTAGMQVRDHRNGGAGYRSTQLPRSSPARAPRSAPSRGVTVRDHRR